MWYINVKGGKTIMEMYFFSLRVSAWLDRFKEKFFPNKKRGKKWKEEFIAEKLFKSFPEGPQYKSEEDIRRMVGWINKGDPEEELSISYIRYVWGTKWEKANPGRSCISDEAYIQQLRY
jgi:hypothetical protein